MSGRTGERIPMHELLSRRLDRVGHCGMPLKGTRDRVVVVMHPPTVNGQFVVLAGGQVKVPGPWVFSC